MANSKLTPSSATTGFFQPQLQVVPQFPDAQDPTVERLLGLYLPRPLPAPVREDLERFARVVLEPGVLRWTRDAETRPPTLHPMDAFGRVNEVDPLRTGEGWRNLQSLGISEGIVGLGFQDNLVRDHGWNVRVWQFAKIWVWTGTAAMVTCPSAMADGAAVLLREHLDGRGHGEDEKGEVFAQAYQRLVNRDPAQAWTSGQWMTERTGGSDVRGTETVAVMLSENEARKGKDTTGMPLGPWSVSGFKWFSSATDSDMAVLLAQTQRGLSAFYAPMRREGGRLNGVRISRLKEKLGTKPVPTAELELNGMRAWLIGEEGRGTKEISRLLNITRLHTAIGQVGYWGRTLAVSRAWTQVRKVSGGMLLKDNRQHVRWMAQETVKYRAAMALVFAGVALLGVNEYKQVVAENTQADRLGLIPKELDKVEVLLRVLTPLMKAQTSLASIEGVRCCMESLGGVGYLENNDDILLNIARLYRDANVGAIWEGTTSVIAEDLIRVLKGKTGAGVLTTLKEWVLGLLYASTDVFKAECSAVGQGWAEFEKIIHGLDVHELHWRGRELLRRLEAVVCAVLLMTDAIVDRDEVAEAVARRWVRLRLDMPAEQGDWKAQAGMDSRIFLGEGSETKARL